MPGREMTPIVAYLPAGQSNLFGFLFYQRSEALANGQCRVQWHIHCGAIRRDADGWCLAQLLALKLWQVGPQFLQHLARHVPDLFECKHRCREWIQAHCMHQVLRVATESGFGTQRLHIDICLAQGGALRWQIANEGGVQAGVVCKGGHLNAAAVWQVGNVSIVAHVAHKSEGHAGGNRFQNV